MKKICTIIALFATISLPSTLKAQEFRMEKGNDTLSILYLKTDAGEQKCKIPYPVYQFQTGDVDGNGVVDAMIGVVKRTRFFPEIGKRIFIYKNYHGKIRTLWMGSKLGGILDDFQFTDGKLRALEKTTDGRYVVAEYKWAHFGMDFQRFIATNVNREEALHLFHSP